MIEAAAKSTVRSVACCIGSELVRGLSGCCVDDC